MNLVASLLCILASCTSAYFFATGLRSGQVEIFGKTEIGKIARRDRPGWYWATLALWLAGMLLGAYYAVSLAPGAA